MSTSKSRHKAVMNRKIRRVMKSLDWTNVPKSSTVRFLYGSGLSRSKVRNDIKNAQDSGD